MNFDEWWKRYCARTGYSFTEDRGLAEEIWNAAQEAVLLPIWQRETMMSARPQQVGTITDNGHARPLYGRLAWSVSVAGSIDVDKRDDAVELAIRLSAVLGDYGIKVEVLPVTVDSESAEAA